MNLLIDTHMNDVVIILFDSNKIIKVEKISGEKNNSTVIMPTIKKVLGDILPESIVVVNGPGSFTGARLAVTIAKTMAFTLQIPIRTITTLECLALSVDSEEEIVAFSDKNGYYVGIFDSNNILVGDYEYITKIDMEEYSKKYTVYKDIDIDYERVIQFVMSKEILNPHEVNPIYTKKIDVEK